MTMLYQHFDSMKFLLCASGNYIDNCLKVSDPLVLQVLNINPDQQLFLALG